MSGQVDENRWAGREEEPGAWGGSYPHPEGWGKCQQIGKPRAESLQDLQPPPPHFPHCALVQLGLEDGLFRGLQAPHARNMKMCHTQRERKTEAGFAFDWKARIWAYLPKRKGSI